MGGASSGEKVKLVITSCTLSRDGNVTIGSDKFEVMLNPSEYSHEYSISYNQKKTLGQLASQAKFDAMKAQKVSFDIVIDGTGVVDKGLADVKTQIQQLNAVIYKYSGNNHQPNHVRLLWGSLIFFGRLESMSANYTLFKPGGEPLRAKVSLSFVGFMSKEEEKLVANKSSPDMTHIVEVKAGDTLPLLCHRIYRDSSYYLAVAKANNIINFRGLKPGTRIHFPPLR